MGSVNGVITIYVGRQSGSMKIIRVRSNWAIPFIAKLAKKVHETDSGPIVEMLKRTITYPTTMVLLAMEGDSVIGYGYANLHHMDGKPVVWVQSVYSVPGDKEATPRMFDILTEWARAHNIKEIWGMTKRKPEVITRAYGFEFAYTTMKRQV